MWKRRSHDSAIGLCELLDELYAGDCSPFLNSDIRWTLRALAVRKRASWKSL